MTRTISAPATHFGEGDSEPYARALRTGSGTLTLRPETNPAMAGPVQFDVSSWCSDANLLERSLLCSLQGPLLDVGCGPGRMLAAARSVGMSALGIDTSSEAVNRARGHGNRAIQQSVFATVPHTGQWQSLLLLDGNIGIGGSISALLRRCRQLVAPTGVLLVEVEADTDLDISYTAVIEDEEGNRSDAFGWARTGSAGLESRTKSSGWTVSAKHHVQGRIFYRLVPRLEPRRYLRSIV